MLKRKIKEFLRLTKTKVIVFLGLSIIPYLIIMLLLFSVMSFQGIPWNSSVFNIIVGLVMFYLFTPIIIGSMFFGIPKYFVECVPFEGYYDCSNFQFVSGIILALLCYFLLYIISCFIVCAYNKKFRIKKQ